MPHKQHTGCCVISTGDWGRKWEMTKVVNKVGRSGARAVEALEEQYTMHMRELGISRVTWSIARENRSIAGEKGV